MPQWGGHRGEWSHDYTRMMRQRYARRPGTRARSVLLEEYGWSTGLERKYAIKVLGGKRRQGRRRGDPLSREIYTASDVKVLKAVCGWRRGSRVANGFPGPCWRCGWVRGSGVTETGL
jgi:hypothetical protein